MAFMDFEKAIDGIEHWAVKGSLINSIIDCMDTDLMTKIYKIAKTTIKLNNVPNL